MDIGGTAAFGTSALASFFSPGGCNLDDAKQLLIYIKVMI